MADSNELFPGIFRLPPTKLGASLARSFPLFFDALAQRILTLLMARAVPYHQIRPMIATTAATPMMESTVFVLTSIRQRRPVADRGQCPLCHWQKEIT
jgi:hypothetical protein